MFARVSTYDGTVEHYRQGLEQMRAQLVPRVRTMSGSVGLLSLIDPRTGGSLTITLWDAEEALAASRAAADEVRAEAASMSGARVTDVTEYEVGVADLP